MTTRRALALSLVIVCLSAGPALAARGGERPPKHRLELPQPQRTALLAATNAGDVTGDGLADAVVRDVGPDSGTLRSTPMTARPAATRGRRRRRSVVRGASPTRCCSAT